MYERREDSLFDTNRDGSLDARERTLRNEYYSRPVSGRNTHGRKADPIMYIMYIFLMMIGIITMIGLPPVGVAIMVAAKSLVE